MKKALITGSRGFVGGYLRAELEANGYEVVGIDVCAGEKTVQADLMNCEQMKNVVEKVQPDAVFHLAGQANVARSWQIPQQTVEINVVGAINLLEAVKAFKPDTRVVLVGSSDQYGVLGDAGRLVKETTPTNPQTPYAVSKQAQEEMARVYARAYGMNICMTRSFNHGGAGQKEGFMIPDFASGIVRIEKGLADCLRVGNLTARRDFTHVKDVVRAYRLIAEKGYAGEIYNVGSGMTYSAQEILDKLCAMASCPIRVEQDPAKMRPSDTPVICCDHSKITNHTGWQSEVRIDEVLSDVLVEWREKLCNG